MLDLDIQWHPQSQSQVEVELVQQRLVQSILHLSGIVRFIITEAGIGFGTAPIVTIGVPAGATVQIEQQVLHL